MLNGLKKWGVVAGMAVTAIAVLFAGGIVGGVLSEVTPALAQDEPVEELPCATRPGLGMVRGGFGGWLGGAWTMFDTAAEALGLTPREFFAESHDSGKSLTEIAEERGEAMRDRIQQGVQDGSMSQEQANWMLQGLDQGFFPGGRGFGHGFGGPMGPPQDQ
jgi:hypothetical protein